MGEVLIANHPLFDEPTLGTVVGEAFYFVANSHWNRFDHEGKRWKFKNIVVERESHLLELTRYIVLNPVRCGAVTYAGDWKWSNYRATAGLRPAPAGCAGRDWK